MRRTLSERCLHRGLALLFEGFHFQWGQKSLRHVSAAAQRWLELLEHEKDFTIIIAGILFRLDVNRTHLTAVLTRRKICSRPVMRVIKAYARWTGSERDAPLAVRRDERRSFLGRAINIHRHFLAMPMKLLGNIGIVEDVDRSGCTLFQPNQWSG